MSNAKERYEALLKEIDEAHHWWNGQMYSGHWQNGRMYSGGGKVCRQTDTCLICGLERRYYSDSENGIDGHYLFSSFDPEGMPMTEARNCAG